MGRIMYGHSTTTNIDIDQEFGEQIYKKISAAKDHWSEWRKAAIECQEFYAGDQWSSEDREKLLNEGRPPVVFNKIPKIVNGVTGLEKQNRNEVAYYPRTQGDAEVNELLTGAAKWVRDLCDAEHEESEAFESCIKVGVGWTETLLDYDDDVEGRVIEENIDALEMLVDPASKKRNFDDARWVARVKPYTKTEFEQEFPDYDGNSMPVFGVEQSKPHDDSREHLYENEVGSLLESSLQEKIYEVIQYQWYDKEFFYSVGEGDKIIDFDESKFMKIKPYIEKKGLKFVKRRKKVFKQALLCGKTVLEASKMPVDGFTFRAVTGLKDDTKRHFFGLIHLMLDPQRWANKWLSQIMHIINSNAKGGILAEQGAFANPRNAEKDWASPSSIVKLNPGGLSKIQQRDAPQYPQGIDRLLQYALESLVDVTGANMEMLGQADRNQPGMIEIERKEAGITILAPFFDSLRRFRKEQGRILAQYIIKYMSDGRLVRIAGKQGEQYVPLLKDNLTFKYDVIVDESPTSTNMRERVFKILMSILPMAIQSGIPVPKDILDYMPLPSGLVNAWKQELGDGQESPEQQELRALNQIMTRLEVEAKSLENEETKSDIALNYAKATKEKALAQDESAQAQNKMGLNFASEQHKQRLDTQRMLNEQKRKDLAMLLDVRRKNLQSKISNSNN